MNLDATHDPVYTIFHHRGESIMELIHNEIPLEFIRNLPEGVKLVVRHGREFLVVERLESRAGASLMADHVHVHGEPAVSGEPSGPASASSSQRAHTGDDSAGAACGDADAPGVDLRVGP